MKTISIIGSGNVAHSMGRALHLSGYVIETIYSIHFENAQQLAEKLKSTAVKDISEINKKSDYLLIAINDDAIMDVLPYLKDTQSILLHTSGSLPLKIFQGYSEKFGVVYPLQSFTKNEELDFLNIPIFIEGNSEESILEIFSLANAISDEVNYLNSEKRKKVHIAAIFVNNFSNHLYTLAEKLLEAESLHFDILRPLILKLGQKMQSGSPKEYQTGPAKRQDLKIIKEHLLLLENQPELKQIYELLSKSIMKS